METSIAGFASMESVSLQAGDEVLTEK